MCQRWDNAGSRPGQQSQSNTRKGSARCLCWAQQLCSLPIFPDGSGCTMLNGEQTLVLLSVLLCSHQCAQRPGSCHLLGCAEGCPRGCKATGVRAVSPSQCRQGSASLLQGVPLPVASEKAEPSLPASGSPPSRWDYGHSPSTQNLEQQQI